MFGKFPERPKKPKKWSRGQPEILRPHIIPGYYAHMGPIPCTNYDTRMLFYRQRVRAAHEAIGEADRAKILQDRIMVQYNTHAERMRFKYKVKERQQQKLKVYDEELEKRRKELMELLYQDEQEFYWETVDKAQRGKETKLEEMKLRADYLKNKREQERLAFVEQKRLQQYKTKCTALRKAITKKNDMEAMWGQFQQMRENEARRERERELDMLYHAALMKNNYEKGLREEMEAVKQFEIYRDLTSTWNDQVKGKELLEAEIKQVEAEDLQEVMKRSQELNHILQNEHIEGKIKSQQRKQELDKQVAELNEFRVQRRNNEVAIDNALIALNKIEMQKDEEEARKIKLQKKREELSYQKYVKTFAQEVKHEQARIDALQEEDRKAVDEKNVERRCKVINASRELLKKVVDGRKQQVQMKKDKLEAQKKYKDEEAEFVRQAMEMHNKLYIEKDRLDKETIKLYRDDLGKQIQYNNLLKKQQEAEDAYQWECCKEEEEKYKALEAYLVRQEDPVHVKHPFRHALEKWDCHCHDKDKEGKNENS